MNTSEQLFARSQKIIPGGVHSPVRSFKGMEMAPRFIKKSWGAYLEDVEGKQYIDFCMSFGPMILGHRHPQVAAAAKNALERGWSYGACEPYSLDLAEFIIKKIPFIEQIRFMSSGTAAVMTALRLARGFTKKNKIIKFDGCYHGHVDSMLIKAGSGLAGSSDPSSAGVPEGVSQDTLILDLNDLVSVEKCFADHPEQIAAIIIEPLPANNGLLIQSQEYLQGLRDLCDRHQALLIFDEVISGFRVSFGGMSELTGITPDIVTYGKIIGGGFPVGAVASTQKIMSCLAPLGGVYQAGTLSANPLAMSAGLANLQALTSDTYGAIAHSTQKIVELFRNFLDQFENGRYQKLNIISHSSLFWFSPVKDLRKISMLPANIAQDFNPLFKELLKRGIYLAPNAYEVGFVSLAHDQKVIDDLALRLKI